MAVKKVYLATRDDLAKVESDKLVIKKSSARTVGNLVLGNSVFITRSGQIVPDEYIVVEKQNGATAVISKSYSPASRQVSVGNDLYINMSLDTYLNNSDTGFLSKFSSEISSLFVERSIKVYRTSPSSQRGLTTINRKVFIPSATEIGLRTDADADSVWVGSGKPLQNAIFRGMSWWTRTPTGTTSSYKAYAVRSDGSSVTETQANFTENVRPVIWITDDANVDNNNNLLPGGITYEPTPITTVQNDLKYYKIKDLEAIHATDVKTPVSSANKIVTENELTDKQDKGKATVNNTEYELGRHTLTITDGSTTTSYNFLTAEVISDGN